MAHTPDLDKIKQTLVKVKALADRGTEGEKKAAEEKLKKLLTKYGIDITEIDNQEVRERDFKHYRDLDSRMILVQVIASVRNTAIFLTKKDHQVHAEMTYNEYIEVLEKYKYFWTLFKKQRDLFKQAFITRNGLHSNEAISDNKCEINKEDSQEIAAMMFSMKKGEFGGKTEEIKYIGND